MSEFITFQEFLNETDKRTAEAHREQTKSDFADSSFDTMQSHVQSLYAGIQTNDVRHSFIAPDGQYVDCVPIDKQPGLRMGERYAKIAEPPAPLTPPARRRWRWKSKCRGD